MLKHNIQHNHHNKDLKNMWTEVIIAKFKVLSWHLTKEAEESHEKHVPNEILIVNLTNTSKKKC
jgi:hypothetical protein